MQLPCAHPQKLADMLKAKGVAQSTIDQYLTITTGSISDTGAVKAALLHKRPSSDGNQEEVLADMILSGIGSVPTFRTEMTLCRDAVETILRGLNELQSSQPLGTTKPCLVLLSTTGISTKKRDVPLAFLPLYHLFLFRPHADKRNMEKVVKAHWNDTSEKDRVIGGYMLIRPSLLTDGREFGLESIRVGMDSKPAIGYTISREDVGLWIFKNAVKQKWHGTQEPINITY